MREERVKSTVRRAPRLVFLAILMVGSVGCAPWVVQGTVTIPHPQATPVQPVGTQVAIADEAVARAWSSLPRQTFVDRAAITRVDEQAVCVQLALFAPPRNDARRALDRYAVRLEVAGDDVVERHDPVVRNVREWVERRNATLYNLWTGVQSQTPVDIRHTVSDLCFVDVPPLDARTERLSLVLTQAGRERRFTWRLSADASYPASGGVEVHPMPDDPPPGSPRRGGSRGGVALSGRGGGGLTAYSVERTPNGHPVDLQRLQAASDARFSLVRQCLSREAERTPELNRMTGVMTAEFTVGPSGIRNVRVLSNDFTPGAAQCMVRHLTDLPIPPDPLRWTSIFRYTIGFGGERGGRR